MDNRYIKKITRYSAPFLTAIILIFVTILLVVIIDLGSRYLPVIYFDILYAFSYSLCIFVLLPGTWIFVAVWLGRRLSKSDKLIPELSYFFAIVALPLACGTICFTSLKVSFYSSDTFPYPTSFPGAVVEETWRDVGHGKYGTITYQYEINQPIAEIEDHYSSEMNTYCSPGWQFEDTDMLCDDYLSCRFAECDIPRKFVPEAQSFRVLLQSEDELETHVIYWETTLNGIFP